MILITECNIIFKIKRILSHDIITVLDLTAKKKNSYIFFSNLAISCLTVSDGTGHTREWEMHKVLSKVHDISITNEIQES